MRRLIDPETGEIIDAIVITDLARFRQAQKHLTHQGRLVRATRRQHRQSASTARWWRKLIGHLAPIVVFGAIATALLLQK